MYEHSDSYNVAIVDSFGSKYYFEGVFTFEEVQKLTAGFLKGFPATDDLSISALYTLDSEVHVYIDYIQF